MPRFKIVIELETTWAWDHAGAVLAAERATAAVEALTVGAPTLADKPLLEVKSVGVERVAELRAAAEQPT